MSSQLISDRVESNISLETDVPYTADELDKDLKICMSSIQEFRVSVSWLSCSNNASKLLKDLSEFFKKSIPNFILAHLVVCIIDKIQTAIQKNNQLQHCNGPFTPLSHILLLLHEKVETLKDFNPEQLGTKFKVLIKALVTREDFCHISTAIPFLLWKPENTSYPKLLAFSEFEEETDLSSQVDKSMVLKTLRHATSTTNFIDLLTSVSDRSKTPTIKMDGNINNTRDLISNVGLVYCGFDVPCNIIDEDDEAVKTYSKPKQFLSENRYGSVLIKFPTSLMTGPNSHVFEFGTKKYFYEYSSVLLVAYNNDKMFFVHDKTNEVVALRKIDFKENEYKCTLKYSSNGDWTHPEVAFVGSLSIALKDCSIEFVNHQCITKYQDKCKDRKDNECLNKEEAMMKFAKKLQHEERCRLLLNQCKPTADLEAIKKLWESWDEVESTPPEAKIPKMTTDASADLSPDE